MHGGDPESRLLFEVRKGSSFLEIAAGRGNAGLGACRAWMPPWVHLGLTNPGQVQCIRNDGKAAHLRSMKIVSMTMPREVATHLLGVEDDGDTRTAHSLESPGLRDGRAVVMASP